MSRSLTMDLKKTLERRAAERQEIATERWKEQVEQTETLEELATVLRAWLHELKTKPKG